jgi:hypothetical protein
MIIPSIGATNQGFSVNFLGDGNKKKQAADVRDTHHALAL